MSTLETLKEARALIAEPETWTQDVGARDSLGQETEYDLSDAVSFCSLAAIYRVAGSSAMTDKAISKLDEIMDGITYFNDGHTHAEVLQLFDEAIARMEKEA